MYAAAPAKRPPRVVTRSKSGAGAIPKSRPPLDPRRDGRHKSSSESSTPSSPEMSSAGRAMYPPSLHQHHPHSQHHQQHHQPPQHHHQQQQGRRHQQPRARQDQQQNQQPQQITPQHMETVRYLTNTWRTVQDEFESSKPSGAEVSSMYYQEPARHPALKDFVPFDLEAFWGQRLYQHLTKGKS